MHSGEFELTKPTNTRLEDNLIRHRGDRLIYNSDNPGTNTDISPGWIPPRTVWKSPMPSTGRSLIVWGSYIIEPAPPGDNGSHLRSRGHSKYLKSRQTVKKTELSRVDTAPHGVETPVPLARTADWFDLHSGPPP